MSEASGDGRFAHDIVQRGSAGWCSLTELGMRRGDRPRRLVDDASEDRACGVPLVDQVDGLTGPDRYVVEVAPRDALSELGLRIGVDPQPVLVVVPDVGEPVSQRSRGEP